MTPILAYWNFPGRAEPIRLLLTYAGVDFIDKGYSKGAAGKGSEWFDETRKEGRFPYKFKRASVNEQEYLEKLDGQLKQLSDFLADRKYSTGKAISYVDFWFYFVLGFLLPNEKVEILLAKYDNLGQFKERVAGLSKVKEFLQKREGN